jgi:hypothetical protein
MLAEANWTQLSVTLLATPALLKSLFYASQAAYASEDALITDSSCGRSCDLAPWAPGDAQLVRFPAGLEDTSVYQAVVGVARRLPAASADTCVVSYRGTSDMRDWWTDLDALPTAAPAAWRLPGCRVHRGFLEAVEAPQDDISVALGPCAGVIYTGHSLGGAMALLGSAGDTRPWRAATSFSAPRALAAGCISQLAPELALLRVTSGRDAVPHLPPGALGYQHAGPELFFDAFAPPRWCVRAYSSACSGRYADPLTWRAADRCIYHGPFFDRVDICTPTLSKQREPVLIV